MVAFGMLIARLIVGLALAAHGAQKAFGWFGGYGLKGTGGFMESLGFRPGTMWAGMAAGGEIVGGLLTAIGLFGPVGPAIIILVMIAAGGSAHFRNGFWATSQGYELNAIYIGAALAIAFGGPGALSLDAALGIGFTPGVIVGVIVAGLILGLVNLGMRRAAPESQTPQGGAAQGV